MIIKAIEVRPKLLAFPYFKASLAGNVKGEAAEELSVGKAYF